MSDEPDPPAGAGEQRELLARLRAVAEAKDAQVAMLRAELAGERELRRRLELRPTELERRLGMDSTNSGTPASKESIGAKQRRKAERKNTSERQRRKDRKGAGSPAMPAQAYPGIRTRMSARPQTRLRSARDAGPAWTARSPQGRRGRRSGM